MRQGGFIPVCCFFVLIAICLSPLQSFAGTAQLTWGKPTTDANGEPLTELTGYRIYYGTMSRTGGTPPGGYNGAGSPVTIANPDQLADTFNSLQDGHTYYFSVVAYNSGGESAFSNEGSKQLCTHFVSPAASQTIGASGGSGVISVTTQGGCAWTASESLDWVTITSSASGSGSGTVNYSVAANGGPGIRTGTITVAGLSFSVRQASSEFSSQYIGGYSGGYWYQDLNGNGMWDGLPTDRIQYFGFPGSVPVAGDWTGNGVTRIGVYADGYWYLDLNGNGLWDAEPNDRISHFGFAGAVPITGDWNNSGTTKIGVYANGYWYLDMNGNGAWDGEPTDKMCHFGFPGASPVIGHWNGAGPDIVGVYANGYWYLDMDGDCAWNGANDAQRHFGFAGALPVTGDWNNSGTTKIGVYANGYWYLDVSGNGVWDGNGTDASYYFGFPGVIPLSGSW